MNYQIFNLSVVVQLQYTVPLNTTGRELTVVTDTGALYIRELVERDWLIAHLHQYGTTCLCLPAQNITGMESQV